MFPVGRRPTVDEVIRLTEEQSFANFPFSISHSPGDAEGWLEVLAAGLAFDLAGALPGPAEPLPEVRHFYGIQPGIDAAVSEAITLRAGAHLAGSENLLPVVRAMAGIAAALTVLADASAVVWHPAYTAMGPTEFSRVVAGWLAGGAFPAIGLTALERGADGSITSEGLAFFTGQELRIEPIPGSDTAAMGKIAVRLIHRMVESAAVTEPCDLTGPEGEPLRAEPIKGGRVLRVWRRGL